MEELFQELMQSGFNGALDHADVTIPAVPPMDDDKSEVEPSADALNAQDNTKWLFTEIGCGSKSLVKVNKRADSAVTAGEIMDRLRVSALNYTAPKDFFRNPCAIQNTVSTALKRGVAHSNEEVLIADTADAASLIENAAAKLARMLNKPSLAALFRNLSDPAGSSGKRVSDPPEGASSSSSAKRQKVSAGVLTADTEIPLEIIEARKKIADAFKSEIKITIPEALLNLFSTEIVDSVKSFFNALAETGRIDLSALGVVVMKPPPPALSFRTLLSATTGVCTYNNCNGGRWRGKVWIPCKLNHSDDRAILTLIAVSAIALGHTCSVCQQVDASSHKSVLASAVGLKVGTNPSNTKLPSECLACSACVTEWQGTYTFKGFADLEDVAEYQESAAAVGEVGAE